VRWGRWLDVRWYVYLWHRSRPESKVWLGMLVIVLLGAGGFYVESVVGSTRAAPADAYIVRRTSVVGTVVQVRNGHRVVKQIRLVRTVKLPAHAVTVNSVRTVTAAGRVKSVPVMRVKYVPLTKVRTATVARLVTTVVTRRGKTTTVVNRDPTTVETTVPVTVQDTQTQTQTQTVNHVTTVTSPPKTTTVLVTTTNQVTVVSTTTRVRTVTVTTTVPVSTATQPTTTKPA
jgi:hypothetical protein